MKTEYYKLSQCSHAKVNVAVFHSLSFHKDLTIFIKNVVKIESKYELTQFVRLTFLDRGQGTKERYHDNLFTMSN